MTLFVAYLVYACVCVVLTVWVGRTLSTNGEVFLLDVLGGQPTLAHAVNRLLLVGFYLITFGYVATTLPTYALITDAEIAVDTFAPKFGGVLLVLGIIHLSNVFLLSRVARRRSLGREPHEPAPVA